MDNHKLRLTIDIVSLKDHDFTGMLYLKYDSLN